MKKFLVILMVVAMASFLFVGCVPTTPAAEEEAAEEEEVVEEAEEAKTDTPYITEIGSISLSSTSIQYVKAEPAVSGVGVAGAIIKVYVDDVQSGVGSTGVSGAFDDIPMSMITLTEGVRKLYVTATVPGLAESDKSTEYTFTYDKTAPTLASAVADSSDNTITVTFSEDVNMITEIAAGTTTSGLAKWAASALNVANWSLLEDGAAVTISAYTFTKVSDKVVTITGSAGAIDTGKIYTVGCDTVYDTATNAIAVESFTSCIAIP